MIHSVGFKAFPSPQHQKIARSCYSESFLLYKHDSFCLVPHHLAFKQLLK